jgi:serine/threonine protein kinase
MTDWKVPGYTELKSIGSGGFGKVILAKHNASGTLVAIKYLRDDLLADPEFTHMFHDEASVLASLDDPNVVRLYEYVESSAGAAIVMELIAGLSLRDILKFQGKTTAEAALAVLQGSLLGLAAAHRRGVVHRDYKPENVLVNGDGISKLTDFGIAARTGDHPVPAGTLAYAAPEQMADAPASPASDIYAATATLYECLTGRPPFSGEPVELLRQHRSEPVPLDPLPEPLQPIVAAGMAKDPRRRPTDATAFVAELNTAASGAYGRGWQERGRSHLSEAALLLAALWPSGPPPTVQGTTVHRMSLRRRIKVRHLSPVKAAIAASVVVAAAAASTALAATGSQRPVASEHPAATAQPVSLQPSPSSISLSLPPSQTSFSPASVQASPSPSQSSLPPSPTPSSPSSPPTPSSPSSPPETSPSPSPTQTSSPAAPPATVCESDGTGCTKAGTYPGPDAVINSDLADVFKVVWTESVVQPYSSGVPLYWTAYVTYTNFSSSDQNLSCPGDWPDASFVSENMSGGAGDDGAVAAGTTTCSQNPDSTVTVPPGGSYTSSATFHNVPWPGSAVALQWGDVGTSAYVYPFS